MKGIISRNTIDKIATLMLWILSGAVLFLPIYIIWYILTNGAGVVNLSFLLESPRLSGAEGGIFPAIVGTLALVTVAILTAVPLGMGAAIYLTSYAPDNAFIRLINFSVEILAGTPSVVIGLFGYAFLVIYLGFGFSILAGGLSLMFMILPWTVRASEEAIKRVSKELSEGSLALGATRWQTIRHVVIPSAMPGITTGVILGIGKAIGETAVIMYTAGSSLLLPRSIFDPVRALPYHLYILASEGISEKMSYGTAVVLLGMILVINLLVVALQHHFGINK
ncbi:Binding-protein-dependent transport system innermembrane component [Candidatus Methanoperedenaceae archaeon GB50]|nr:MAG: Binding-protein-dependent transport system innermembrane component [Candidatus Methanoperedenaceae archaeon GB50]CAD7772336.1 Binding-protein-dependent transport system innermembrane component [Candidatus Methanoperedenaceae archaeon GB37]CAD7772449.1 Binding-protein-dependent transport system innermembrane component [Candidatus Methanoperedenaceae archaeon GB50]